MFVQWDGLIRFTLFWPRLLVNIVNNVSRLIGLPPVALPHWLMVEAYLEWRHDVFALVLQQTLVNQAVLRVRVIESVYSLTQLCIYWAA